MDPPVKAVLPVVDKLAGMKGVTGGELCGGGGFGKIWGFGLRWFPSEFEALGGSARLRGVERWHQMDEGGSGCNERDQNVAAAESAGDEGEGFPSSMAGHGGSGGVA